MGLEQKTGRRLVVIERDGSRRPVRLSNRRMIDRSLYGSLTPPQRAELLEFGFTKGLTHEETLQALRSRAGGTERHFTTTVGVNLIGQAARRKREKASAETQ